MSGRRLILRSSGKVGTKEFLRDAIMAGVLSSQPCPSQLATS